MKHHGVGRREIWAEILGIIARTGFDGLLVKASGVLLLVKAISA
jgi:hypothetical protein